MENKRNILICPLEWGLGHATRMVALAAKLRKLNYNIIAGAGEEHLALFRNEIPGIDCILFPGFKPRYSRHLPQYAVLLLQAPALLYHAFSEHFRLNRIIRKYNIDIVISDNRFGLWNRRIMTIYITHQVRIAFPESLRIFEFLGIFLHRAVMKRYSACFIPDLEDDVINLSGRLSHGIKLPGNTIYIGVLSRFMDVISHPEDSPAAFRHNTVILSGPEPQKTILRDRLEMIMKKREPVGVFLGGKPGSDSPGIKTENIIFFDHLRGPAMKELISGSERIITRSGYTTIMELISLGRTALLIPTPGQTEQEYLAKWMKEKGWFTTIRQKDLKDELPENNHRVIPAEEILSQSGVLFERALRIISEDQQ